MSTEILLGSVWFVLGVAVSYIFYRWSIKIKQSCFAMRHNNLVKGYSADYADLKIIYKETTVENLTVSKVLFWNNGNETILKNNIAEKHPIFIFANRGVEILDAKMLETNSPASGFSISFSKEVNIVDLGFDYLDSQDGVVIQIIHTGTGQADDLYMTGKVIGGKAIEYKVIKEADWTLDSWGLLSAIGLLAMLFYAFRDLNTPNLNGIRMGVDIGGIILIILTMIWAFLSLISLNRTKAKLPKGITQF
jgi:hypothetical protein